MDGRALRDGLEECPNVGPSNLGGRPAPEHRGDLPVYDRAVVGQGERPDLNGRQAAVRQLLDGGQGGHPLALLEPCRVRVDALEVKISQNPFRGLSGLAEEEGGTGPKT